MPAAEHSNGVMVDSTTEEGHSAPRAKGSSTGIFWMQTCLMRGGECTQVEGLGDVLFLDRDTFAVVKIGGEGCGFCRLVKVKMVKPTEDCLDGTHKGVGDEAMGDDFAMCSIFMYGEREGHRSCGVKVFGGGCHSV
jgi:hypothetical protein